MSSEEVESLVARTRTVVIACGSIEQHGPHMPLLSDWYQGEYLVRRIAATLGERGITVAGGLSVPFAPAEDALPFAGTISITSETYIRLLDEIVDSLYRHGFRRFPFIVCHEQVIGPLMSAVRAINARYADAKAAVLTGWIIAGIVGLRDELCTGPSPGRDGHAGELETSRMLVVRPELVELARAGIHYPEAPEPIPHASHPMTGGGLYQPVHDYHSLAPDGYVGAASEATAEKGVRQLDVMVGWLSDVIARDLL